MTGFTKGPIRFEDCGPTDEAFFYYPGGDPGDFAEPMVFAVTAMHRELAPVLRAINEGRPAKFPAGVELQRVPIDKDYARHLTETGAAERPLVEAALARRREDHIDGLVYYAMSSPPDAAPEARHGTLIDGVHRYVAACEAGDAFVYAAVMYPPFFERFTIAGIPHRYVLQAQGSGPEETTRSEYERRRGRIA